MAEHGQLRAASDTGRDALQSALTDWRSGRTSWEGWAESTERSRESFARLVGTDADRVAVGGTVSELVGLLAAAVPDRSHVVVAAGDFTSLLFPWLVHADRGVEVHPVALADLAHAVDATTDVVAFSVVQSATGEVADIDAIVRASHAHGALVVVDATQACGWLPVPAAGIDAMVCAGYKWCTAPALALIEQIGVEAIHAHNVALANRFRAGLDLPAGQSAIVSAAVPDADRRLAAAGIRAATRAGSLRVSFHVYSTDDDVDNALNALAS